METPTVHLNGTSASALLESFTEQRAAVQDALTALLRNSPNARDYYVAGPDAFRRADAEHEARIAKLTAVRDELSRLCDSVDEQVAARARRRA
jgi:hypothetical protein